MVTAGKQLKKFLRVNLKAGEQKTLEFGLTEEDLMLFTDRSGWIVEPGEFEILIGASSDDIRLKKNFSVEKPLGGK